MKTKNNVQKTENRNFGSYFSKTFAIVASLVLISFAAGATENWKYSKVENLFGLTPSLSQVNEEIKANIFSIEASTEKSLEIEGWMTDKNLFGLQTLTVDEEIEEPLRVEEWMLSGNNFATTMNVTEKEAALSIENWMMDKSIWRK